MYKRQVEDLKDDISVSQSDIQLEYDEYLNLFDSTVRKSVSHIMLNITDVRNIESALEELNTIKQRISNGEEFINLVSEVSEDEGTKDQGGSLGVTDGTLLPVLAALCLTLKVPKPTSETLSPPARLPAIAFNVASTALPASAFDVSVAAATASVNWALFTFIS